MPANKELLSVITELLMNYKGRQGDKAAQAPPPPESAPAAGAQGDAPAGEASPDPRVVIPKAPRQPFNWRNEVNTSYPGKYSPIGTQNAQAASGRDEYGRFGQRYTSGQSDSGSGGDAQPQAESAPAGTQNRRVWRGCFRPFGYRASTPGQPWPWER